MAREITGVLIDADYRQKGPDSVIRLFVKTPEKTEELFDPDFEPYFYVSAEKNEKMKKILLEKEFEGVKVKKIEIVEKQLSPNEKPEKLLKLIFHATFDLTKWRDKVVDIEGFKEKREYDIPFHNRYLIDKQLEPTNLVKIKADGNEVLEIKKAGEPKEDFTMGSFDLETYSRGKFSDAKTDPILTISYASKKTEKVLSTKKIKQKYVQFEETEQKMIQALVDEIKKDNPDFLITYNGDSFDFPYLKDRAEQFKIKLDMGLDGAEPKAKRKGFGSAVQVKGRPHLDAFQIVRILARFQVINLLKYDLESVSEALLGEKKEKIQAAEINQIWDSGKDLEKLADYNIADAITTHKLTEQYLPLFLELSRLVKHVPFDSSRTSAGQLVEYLLMNKAFIEGILIPNKPFESDVKSRDLSPITGGYVKEPRPGLHENLAVLDFTSLHPSIMISHNISPDTLNCGHADCKKKNSAPTGDYFCTEKKGFMSGILEELFNRRKKLKKELKELKKGSREYKLIHARQHALKIVLNSFYGTLVFPRFRWYSRECGAAVTAWSRQYVKMISKRADENGFESIYGDTDSAFLKIPENKTKQNVKEFVKKINSELPGIMNLELEDFYKRGIFVTKESGEAAKKRYALVDFKGNLKIVGFEYVRRDWAGVAKETQREVIAAILDEGDVDKAAKIVKEKIKQLKDGKTPKKDLTVFTQIRQGLDEYKSVGPHIAAAKKAVEKGKDLDSGSIIEYIITRRGKSISDKAQLAEYVKEGDYDEEYYISNQVIPAVIKIMRELGYSEDDLNHGGKQVDLSSFS